MTTLILGIAVFFAIHAIPLSQSTRAALISRLGEKPFKGLFSLVSIAGFAAIVAGMKSAPFVPVWNPPAWSAMATGLVMPIAFCLLVAAYVPNNIRNVVRNPMLSATFLWAVAHLLSNGDKASILLFGSFGAFAIIDRISVNRRSEVPASTKKPLYFDALTIAIGLIAFWLIRYFHGSLFGVPLAF